MRIQPNPLSDGICTVHECDNMRMCTYWYLTLSQKHEIKSGLSL